MSSPASPAWYALRRTLPPFRFDELLQELVDQLPHYRVDEVILKIDTEELSHGHLTPEIAATYLPRLNQVRNALNAIGVRYSLNPWVTRGHEARNRSALPGMQTVVSPDGTQSSHLACPLCPIWQNNLLATWSLYATTQPHVFWIEDDIRDWGDTSACFCPLHLKHFSEHVGHTVTRQELITAIHQPGPPHPWRGLLLSIRHQSITRFLARLRTTLNQSAPNLHFGLMSSGPRNHCREGRNWTELAQALGSTPETPIYSRPTLGNYWEWSPPRGLYFSQDSIKLTRHVLPPTTIDYTEVENVPFSRYAKSTTFTFAQIAVSFAFGAQGTTLNLFDHLGTPMQAEPHYGNLLHTHKPFFNNLASRAQLPGTFRGIQLLHHSSSATTHHLSPGDSDRHLSGEGHQVMEALEAAGIPTTYDPSPVVFLAGQQPRFLSDDEIVHLLHHGLFLDGTAASILCERGFSHLIGVTASPPQSLEHHGILSVEAHLHPEFGGAPFQHLSTHLPQASYTARLSTLISTMDTVVISQMLNPDLLPVLPAMTAFENSLGGRVIVHTWDYASAIGPLGVSFHHPIRQRQLHAATRWLFHNAPPLLVSGDGAWPLCLRKDTPQGVLLGLFNLSLDPWPSALLECHLPENLLPPQRLSMKGEWESAEGVIQQESHITLQTPITLLTPSFLWFPRKSP